MKKTLSFFLCLIICFIFAGCKNGKESYVFADLGIEVKMQVDETISVSRDNNGILISDIESNDAIGVISVSKEKGKNINEIYDTYIIGEGEFIKTEISDNLIFVEVSAVLGERVDKMYCFIYYDENTEAVLYGRFFSNNERDYVISFAKAIEVAKI